MSRAIRSLQRAGTIRPVVLLPFLLFFVAIGILPASAAPNEIAVVMTRKTGLSGQFVILHNQIPFDEIRSRFEQDYTVTSLIGSSAGWVTIISQGARMRGQTIDGRNSSVALQVELQSIAQSDQIMTTLEYGGGIWAFGVSRPIVPQQQVILAGKEFPEAEVKSYFAKGYNMTAFDYGGEVGLEEWVVLMTNNTGFGKGELIRSKSFPEKQLKDAQAKGLSVTNLRKGNDEWIATVTKGTGWGDQKIFYGSDYPQAGIDSSWWKGYEITSIEVVTSSMIPTRIFKNDQVEGLLERLATLQSGLAYTEFIERNAGTDYGFVAVQRMAGYYIAQRQWDQAIGVYNRYRPMFPERTKTFDKIIEILQRPDSAIILNLGPNINTIAGEFMPLVTADDQNLYFTGMNRPGGVGGEDIFVSARQGEGWGPAVPLRGYVNSRDHEFGTAISADGNQMVLFASRADGLGSGDLYYSDKQAGSFGAIHPFSSSVNSSFWDCDGFLTSDGKAILFASDRPGAVGTYQKKDVLYRGERWGNVDIYVSLKTDTGWSQPINLGPTINTGWAERSPFLHPDGKTLYFCSSGHPGLGKLDVFVSTRLKEDSWTEWSEPVNLGKAINGVGSDWGYRVNTVGTHAYFAAEGLVGSRGGSDIYAQELPKALRPQEVATIHGVVRDTDGNPLKVSIKWEDLSLGKNVGELSSDEESGNYFITLPLGKNYGYYAEKDGFYPVTQNIDLRNTTEGVDIEVNIVLTPIETIAEEGRSVRLNNIFFDIDKATLRPESETELDRFAKLIERFPNAVIEISGHTDSTASEAYNQSLSQRRAQSVVDYLVTRGIPRPNLIAKGYGESAPVADNGTEEGRSLNRRVEFRFLKKEEIEKLRRP